jgi:hypothetical protein
LPKVGAIAGYVMLRIHYPFQAATLSNYYRDPNNPLGVNTQAIEASDPVNRAALETAERKVSLMQVAAQLLEEAVAGLEDR